LQMLDERQRHGKYTFEVGTNFEDYVHRST